MNVGIGLILELTRKKPAMSLGKLDRLDDRDQAALRRRREHHLDAQEAEEPAPLDAEILRHRDDQRIALLGADHGEPDPSMAARHLDHGLSRLQLAGAFGRLDHAERKAILDRSERSEEHTSELQSPYVISYA